jgi:hypothetical protein
MKTDNKRPLIALAAAVVFVFSTAAIVSWI